MGMTKSVRILAVDDEPINLEVLAEILGETCNAKFLSESDKVLSEVNAWQPHVIILDIMMPGINGYDLCAALRAKGTCPFTKIMLVTGKALSEERLKGYVAGADEYLVKPFLHEEFSKKLENLCDLATREEEARRNAALRSNQIKPGGVARLRPLIFAVDDDAINLEVIKESPFDDATVRCFTNAAAFLEAIQSGSRPDLVLMDIMMPGMNGFEACESFRKIYSISEVPLIFLSALTGPQDVDRGFAVGGNDFVRKPFEPKELVRRAKSLLTIYRHSTSIRRFVPWPMLTAMGLADPALATLGDCRVLDITLMFADLRGFTSTSEFMDPASTFSHLQKHIETIAPLVKENQGWVDKYIGDCLMACFANAPENSLDCALKVVSSTQSKMAIALHCGEAALGWVGAESAKIEGTVVSDLVNSTSRLEGIAKKFGVSIVVSESVFRKTNNFARFSFRLLGKFHLSGKMMPVSAYELLTADSHAVLELKRADVGPFEKAVLHFQAGNRQEAELIFKQILMRNPDDAAAAAYLGELRTLIAQTA